MHNPSNALDSHLGIGWVFFAIARKMRRQKCAGQSLMDVCSTCLLSLTQLSFLHYQFHDWMRLKLEGLGGDKATHTHTLLLAKNSTQGAINPEDEQLRAQPGSAQAPGADT